MPALLDRLTHQLAAKGVKDAKSKAAGILTKRGDMQGGKLTPHGKERQSLGAAGRAKDREAKYSGGKHKASDYTYDAKTNSATLKRSK